MFQLGIVIRFFNESKKILNIFVLGVLKVLCAGVKPNFWIFFLGVFGYLINDTKKFCSLLRKSSGNPYLKTHVKDAPMEKNKEIVIPPLRHFCYGSVQK